MITPYKMWIDDVHLISLGGFLVTLPRDVYPAKRVREYHVAGRSGVLTRWMGDYDTTTRSIEVYCEQKDLNRVMAALSNARRIRYSDEPERVHHVHLWQAIKVESLDDYGRLISLTYTVQPYKTLHGHEPVTGKSVSILNPGDAIARPRIKVTGSGSLTVNGQTWILSNVSGAIYLDRELGTVTDTNGNAWHKINRSDLPITGINEDIAATTTATGMEVDPQWAVL